MTSNLRFLDLPLEIIHKILCLLAPCPMQLANCQLVNKFLNAIISESLILQYSIALASVRADDHPGSMVPLPQKLKNVRSSEAAWDSLQPKFIASLPIRHRTSGIYDLSAGTYLLGNVDRMNLQYLRLPTRVDDPLDWKKISVDKTIIDMGFCVLEHDLIAVITSAPSTTQPGLWNIEMTLLEYSTGRPHPSAKNSTILVTSYNMSSSILPALMCEIVGENLVLVLNSVHDQDDRVFIWNWSSDVLKVAFTVPYRTYSGILFLEEDLIILPNATSAAFDFFRIPTKPTTDSLQPILSLGLPSLADGVEIDIITCRAEPNPMPTTSRINRGRRAQERADVGSDETDPFAPKRGFLASGEDALCLFQISVRDTFIAIAGAINIHFDPTTSYTLFVHRSSFLEIARHETPNPPLPGVALDPRRIAWAEWGPPVSRWFNAANTPTRWITTSAGQRCVMIHHDIGVYMSPITILDFNPFNIRKTKAKLKREKKLAREKWKFHKRPRSTTEVTEEKCQYDTVMEPADEEDEPSSASEFGEPLSSPARSPAWTETGTSQGIDVEDENDPVDMPFFSDVIDEMEEEDHESLVTIDDDSEIFIGYAPGDADSDSMPGLESLIDSDEESDTPSRYPGLALCRVFDSPSRDTSRSFAEEVEGRLPYVEYISKNEYAYKGVLLDEERILGLMTDASFRISNIDIFYFG